MMRLLPTKLLVLAVAFASRTALTDEGSSVDPYLGCKGAAASRPVRVNLKSETSLKDLVVWARGFTCKNYVFDDGIATSGAKVGIVAQAQLAPADAIELFKTALGRMNLELDPVGNTIAIVVRPGLETFERKLMLAPEGEPELEPNVGITKIDETHYIIERAIFDKVLDQPMILARAGRIVPSVNDGKPDGFKVYAIRPNSVYDKIGFQNGDTIHSINGFDVTSPEKALWIYTKAKSATSLSITVTRRGQPVNLDYRIK